jgi:hypothetical protein
MKGRIHFGCQNQRSPVVTLAQAMTLREQRLADGIAI